VDSVASGSSAAVAGDLEAATPRVGTTGLVRRRLDLTVAVVGNS
jgi:hypothetical protein